MQINRQVVSVSINTVSVPPAVFHSVQSGISVLEDISFRVISVSERHSHADGYRRQPVIRYLELLVYTVDLFGNYIRVYVAAYTGHYNHELIAANTADYIHVTEVLF